MGVQLRDAFIATLGYGGSQWGPVELVCLCLCLSVSTSVSLSLYLFIRIDFWWSKCVSHNCVQCMQPHATGSNSLSGRIICPSLCRVVRRNSSVFVFVFNSFNTREMVTITITIASVGIQCRNAFSTNWGTKYPSGVQSSLCVYISVSLSLCHSVWQVAHVYILLIICTARNFTHSMRP